MSRSRSRSRSPSVVQRKSLSRSMSRSQSRSRSLSPVLSPKPFQSSSLPVDSPKRYVPSRRASKSRSPTPPAAVKTRSPTPPAPPRRSRSRTPVRSPSQEGTPKRIRRGRGFSQQYSYARRYRTPSPDRSPPRSYRYGGRGDRDRHDRGRNDRYSL